MAAASLCGITTSMFSKKGLYLMLAMLGGTYGAWVVLPLGVFAALHALPDNLYANYIWPLTNYSDLNACPYGFPVWGKFGVDITKPRPPSAGVGGPPRGVHPVLCHCRTAVVSSACSMAAGRVATQCRTGWPVRRSGLQSCAGWISGTCATAWCCWPSFSFRCVKVGGCPAWRRVGLVTTLCVTLAGTMNWVTVGLPRNGIRQAHG
jgi:hypothetical protein